MLFLSIATVHCWALTWSWWSGFSQHLIYSVSALVCSPLCACVCVCVSVCALYVFLWACLCLFVDEDFQDVVCLVESISEETQSERGEKQHWQTLAPAKPDNEVVTFCCQNPQKTWPHRYDEEFMCIQLSIHLFFCSDIFLTVIKMNSLGMKSKTWTQIPSLNSSCTWTQEPNYRRRRFVYL